MLNSLALTIALISLPPADGQPLGSPQAAEGPSFRCTGSLSPTEALICGDSELSAYDRAMAFAYSHKWQPDHPDWADQKAWLVRRDACGRRRGCVLDLYRAWIGGIAAPDYYGASLSRIGDVPADGSDLMLGSLQSSSGKVAPLGDSGDLSIRAVGGGWYLFKATAAHFYDPDDGRGANVSTSEAMGLVHLDKGKGVFTEDPEMPKPCAVAFTKLPNGKWQLKENGNCSGVGSTLSGTYAKQVGGERRR